MRLHKRCIAQAVCRTRHKVGDLQSIFFQPGNLKTSSPSTKALTPCLQIGWHLMRARPKQRWRRTWGPGACMMEGPSGSFLPSVRGPLQTKHENSCGSFGGVLGVDIPGKKMVDTFELLGLGSQAILSHLSPRKPSEIAAVLLGRCQQSIENRTQYQMPQISSPSLWTQGTFGLSVRGSLAVVRGLSSAWAHKPSQDIYILLVFVPSDSICNYLVVQGSVCRRDIRLPKPQNSERVNVRRQSFDGGVRFSDSTCCNLVRHCIVRSFCLNCCHASAAVSCFPSRAHCCFYKLGILL